MCYYSYLRSRKYETLNTIIQSKYYNYNSCNPLYLSYISYTPNLNINLDYWCATICE